MIDGILSYLSVQKNKLGAPDIVKNNRISILPLNNERAV